MYLGTGNPILTSVIPNKMFRNVDGHEFVDVTTSARVGHLQKGHAVSFADIDNDGDQDIYTDIGGAYSGDAYPNSFFVNPGQGSNHWIGLVLQGVSSNRSAIGARIKISLIENGVPRTLYRDVNSGGSFGSSPLRREIGLGTALHVNEIEIRWPGSGTVQIFKNVASNQFIKITEGRDEILKIDLKPLSWPGIP
jgi:ASPIC and UnbV/FG-GAP-like repeat